MMNTFRVLLACLEWERARRYVAGAHLSPRYLTAYDLSIKDAFESPEGLKARKTPWTVGKPVGAISVGKAEAVPFSLHPGPQRTKSLGAQTISPPPAVRVALPMQWLFLARSCRSP
jgi:hypothetical protein